MIKIKGLIILGAMIALVSSCSIGKMTRFANCEFEFKNITTLEAKGISLLNKSGITSLGFKDGAVLSQAFMTKNIPINLDVLLNIKNPNSKKAQLNQLDYILLLDGEQVLDGTTRKKIVIEGGQSTDLELNFQFELFDALSEKSASEVIDIIWDLAADTKRPKNLKMKVRPYFYIGEKSIKYPGYVSVMKM